MKMSVKKALADIYTSVMSRPAMQPLNEAMLKFTLYAMGIGYSEESDRNGERRWLDLLHSQLNAAGRSRPVIFDVGANIGEYTRQIASVFGDSVEIHAFEPARITFERLREHTASLAASIHYNCAGIGRSTGSATLYSDGDGSTLASLHPRDLERFDRTMDRTEMIEITTVDDYCAHQGIDHIDLLKLDIEGNEYDALCGASRMMSERRIDCIQFEFGSTTLAAHVSFHDLYTLLKPEFDVYRLLKRGMRRIARYRETDEIFMYQNLVALRRR